MLFISRFYPYEHVIQNGISRFEIIGAGPMAGTHQEIIVRPELKAVFHRGVLPFAAREEARQQFDEKFGASNGDPPGPYRRAGIASDPDFAGVMYEASEEPMFYSFFDTATDCPTSVPTMTDAEVRGLFESVLSASGDLASKDIILVEQPRLAAPWPAYDTLITAAGVSTATVAKRIAETTDTIGLDPQRVAAYERENQNREYVIAALAELEQRRAQEHREVEALNA